MNIGTRADQLRSRVQKAKKEIVEHKEKLITLVKEFDGSDLSGHFEY